MRSWIVVSAALIGAGLGLFLYKVLYLGYPLTTAEEPGTWRVEQVLNVAGQRGRVVVEVPLPRTSAYQQLLTEEVRSGLLRFSIHEQPGGRRGRWSGKLDGSTSVRYQVTFATLPYHHDLPPKEERSAYPRTVSTYLEPSESVQSTDPAVADLSRELALDPTEKVALARDIFHFVSREIGSLRSSGPMDALSVIREGRGDPLGRARLFCALSRQNELPCRVVTGLLLGHDRQAQPRYWNEVYVDDGWVPFDAIEQRSERFLPNRLVLSTRDDLPVESRGTSGLSYRYFVQPETETYAELVRRRLADSQHAIDRLSLLLLPVEVQQSLRFLLLVPLGALAMCVLRNVVGIRTFGTFMPMLIALAMTATGLVLGTSFLVIIVAFALLSRLWIQRFYLLLAPRVAFTLTLVVLLMVGVLLAGDRLALETTGVGAFPFVIMTMIVERISVSLEEEGVRNTVNRVTSTLFAIYVTYAVIQAKLLQALFLVFPELLVVILGFLVVVGRYTGYRLTELLRFRELLAARAQSASELKSDAAA